VKSERAPEPVSSPEYDFDIAVEIDDAVATLAPAGISDRLHEIAAAVLLHEGVADASLAVVLTSDEEVQQLNQAYRGVDAPTDVLSFAAHDSDVDLQEMPEELQAALARELGDVLIALPYAERQARRFGNSLEAELLLLTAHGVLHLLGHDHATPDEEAALWTLQEEILRPFGVVGLSTRGHDE